MAGSIYRTGKSQTRKYADIQADFPLSVVLTEMSSVPSITFNHAGDPDTITRNDNGSFKGDDFKIGQQITIAGSSSNDGTYTIDDITDKVITLVIGDTLVASETDASGVTIVANSINTGEIVPETSTVHINNVSTGDVTVSITFDSPESIVNNTAVWVVFATVATSTTYYYFFENGPTGIKLAAANANAVGWIRG